jgi:hypothetical protein
VEKKYSFRVNAFRSTSSFTAAFSVLTPSSITLCIEQKPDLLARYGFFVYPHVLRGQWSFCFGTHEPWETKHPTYVFTLPAYSLREGVEDEDDIEGERVTKEVIGVSSGLLSSPRARSFLATIYQVQSSRMEQEWTGVEESTVIVDRGMMVQGNVMMSGMGQPFRDVRATRMDALPGERQGIVNAWNTAEENGQRIKEFSVEKKEPLAEGRIQRIARGEVVNGIDGEMKDRTKSGCVQDQEMMRVFSILYGSAVVEEATRREKEMRTVVRETEIARRSAFIADVRESEGFVRENTQKGREREMDWFDRENVKMSELQEPVNAVRKSEKVAEQVGDEQADRLRMIPGYAQRDDDGGERKYMAFAKGDKSEHASRLMEYQAEKRSDENVMRTKENHVHIENDTPAVRTNEKTADRSGTEKSERNKGYTARATKTERTNRKKAERKASVQRVGQAKRDAAMYKAVLRPMDDGLSRKVIYADVQREQHVIREKEWIAAITQSETSQFNVYIANVIQTELFIRESVRVAEKISAQAVQREIQRKAEKQHAEQVARSMDKKGNLDEASAGNRPPIRLPMTPEAPEQAGRAAVRKPMTDEKTDQGNRAIRKELRADERASGQRKKRPLLLLEEKTESAARPTMRKSLDMLIQEAGERARPRWAALVDYPEIGQRERKRLQAAIEETEKGQRQNRRHMQTENQDAGSRKKRERLNPPDDPDTGVQPEEEELIWLIMGRPSWWHTWHNKKTR